MKFSTYYIFRYIYMHIYIYIYKELDFFLFLIDSHNIWMNMSLHMSNHLYKIVSVHPSENASAKFIEFKFHSRTLWLVRVFFYKTSGPIAAWKCNFLPFIKLWQTNQSTIDLPSDRRTWGSIHFHNIPQIYKYWNGIVNVSLTRILHSEVWYVKKRVTTGQKGLKERLVVIFIDKSLGGALN